MTLSIDEAKELVAELCAGLYVRPRVAVSPPALSSSVVATSPRRARPTSH